MARKKEFQKEDVLNRAMYVFWKKGYEATTIPDLMTNMGIRRSSLYDTFTDKETLFKEALANYDIQVNQPLLKHLYTSSFFIEGLRNYFYAYIDSVTDVNNPGGCLFVNTITMADNIESETIRSEVKEGVQAFELEFVKFLKQAQEDGMIEHSINIGSIAKMIVSMLYGMAVLTRVNKDANSLKQMIELYLHALKEKLTIQ